MPSPTKLTDPLDILVEYGYLDDETPYHKAVSNAVNDFSADQTLGGENNRDYLSILQNEAKKELKLRRKKISASAFKKGSSVGGAEKVAADTTGVSALTIQKPKGSGDIAKAEDVTPKAQPTSGLIGPLKTIDSGVNGIIETLKASNKADAKAQSNARKQAEKDARAQKEGKLEGIKGKLANAAETVLKPVTSIFEKIWNFLKTVFLGRVVMKLFDWFANPANAKKIASLFRFLKDWWPVIVAGIMAVVGPGIIFTAGLIALLVWGVPKIIEAVKWVGSLFGIGVDKELKTIEKESAKTGDDLVDTMDKDLTKDTESVLSNNQQEVEGAPDVDKTPAQVGETQQQATDVQAGADKVEAPALNQFAQGGIVPGSGNRDTVPAMLTPGEFVMSKGAVQQYGSNTLAGMNAAAGGTNKPTFGRYSGGGEVKSGGPRIHYNGGGIVNMNTSLPRIPVQYFKGGGEVKKPQGMMRWLAGAADVATGGVFDFDKRGSMVDGAKRMVQGAQKTLDSGIIPLGGGRQLVIVGEEDPVGDANTKVDARTAPGQELPEFSATQMRSLSKIKTLGIVA